MVKMDLESIMIVSATVAGSVGGLYGMNRFGKPLISSSVEAFGYNLGEGISQGLTMGLHKALTGQELDPTLFETPEVLAARWKYKKPVLTSGLGFTLSALAVSTACCVGIPTSVYTFVSSF